MLITAVGFLPLFLTKTSPYACTSSGFSSRSKEGSEAPGQHRCEIYEVAAIEFPGFLGVNQGKMNI
jgi:hypothetical protein